MREPVAYREKRGHIRYHPQNAGVVHLFYLDGDGVKMAVPALVADESRKGMAVIIVGLHRLPEKSTIYWQETEKICTQCTIIHCKELDEGVFRLALELHDPPAAPRKQR